MLGRPIGPYMSTPAGTKLIPRLRLFSLFPSSTPGADRRIRASKGRIAEGVIALVLLTTLEEQEGRADFKGQLRRLRTAAQSCYQRDSIQES
jgi:hypothetical protein